MSNQGVKTSQEVYNRILWDKNFHTSRFIIGYQTRHQGFREIAFDAFLPEQIPWHRVWYFRTETEYWWDRRIRFDGVFGSGVTQSKNPPFVPQKPQKETVPKKQKKRDRSSLPGTQSTVLHFDKNKWCAYQATQKTPQTPQTTLSIVSFNVFASPDIETDLESRFSLLCKKLTDTQADILSLVESSPAFLQRLLQEQSIRSSYYITNCSQESFPFTKEQIILSRYPILQASAHAFSKQKGVIIAEIDTPSGLLIAVNLHLTSNAQKQAKQKRIRQWNWLLDEVFFSRQSVWNGAHFVFSGDFNARQEEFLSWQAPFPGIDAWNACYPEKPGFTFDPDTNRLAKQTSLSGKPARFDRILLGPGQKAWQVLNTTLLGEEPVQNIFASDHYGVYTKASFSQKTQRKLSSLCLPKNAPKHWKESTPIHRTALVIIPPASIWNPIQEIRKEFDPSYDRWMPHITLLYGFLPERLFSSAARAISLILKEFSSFTVTLGTIRSFYQKNSQTIWLEIKEPIQTLIRDLQKKLFELFPSCVEQNTKSKKGFTPHLTLAKFSTSQMDTAANFIQTWQQSTASLSFSVDGIYLISRREEESFVARDFIPFSKNVSPLYHHQFSFPTIQKEHIAALQLVQSICDTALASPSYEKHALLYLTGSAQLGVLRKTSDLDLVCIGPKEVSLEKFAKNFSVICSMLDIPEQVSHLRLVKDAFVPLLKADVLGIPFDILYVQKTLSNLYQNFAHWNFDEIDSFSPTDQIALGALLHNHAITKRMHLQFQINEFRTLLRYIISWAKKRGLYENRLGFLGGFSWAVLVAAFLEKSWEKSQDFPKNLLHFFQTCFDWPWPEPISIQSKFSTMYQTSSWEKMPILTPYPPIRNSARNVCRSTLEIMKKEFYRAIVMLDKNANNCLQKLTEKIDISREGEFFLTISPKITVTYFKEDVYGYFSSRFIALLLSLEKTLDMVIRPIMAKKDSQKLYILAFTSQEKEISCTQAKQQTAKILEKFSTQTKEYFQQEVFIEYCWKEKLDNNLFQIETKSIDG